MKVEALRVGGDGRRVRTGGGSGGTPPLVQSSGGRIERHSEGMGKGESNGDRD
jgi:hypothetical protein